MSDRLYFASRQRLTVDEARAVEKLLDQTLELESLGEGWTMAECGMVYQAHQKLEAALAREEGRQKAAEDAERVAAGAPKPPSIVG